MTPPLCMQEAAEDEMYRRERASKVKAKADAAARVVYEAKEIKAKQTDIVPAHVTQAPRDTRTPAPSAPPTRGPTAASEIERQQDEYKQGQADYSSGDLDDDRAHTWTDTTHHDTEEGEDGGALSPMAASMQSVELEATAGRRKG